MPVVRRGGALVAAAVLSLAGLVLAAPAASAHNEVVSTEPAAKAELTVAPTEVVLHFAEPPVPGGTAIAVKDPQGRSVVAGAAALSGSDATVALEPLTVAGTYTVSYRSVSDDGHTIGGTYTFTLALPSPSGSASEPPSASPTQPAAPSQSEAVVPGTPSPQPGPSGAGALPWVVGLGALVVVALVGWALSRRTRS